jgi:8-oxo-dGTP pyrophosphatase MutT (NUDIX family)
MALSWSVNHYGDTVFTIDPEAPSAEVVRQLSRELATNVPRGALLTLESRDSQERLLSEAVKLGFRVYSVKGEAVTLRYWAQPGADKIFCGPFTATSAAGMVVDARGKILFVRQRYAGSGARMVLPAGYTDPGESVAECAAREVFEETGIRAEVVSLLLIREMQRHENPLYSTSMQFVFLMRPMDYSAEALTPKPDEDEIAEARWVPHEEYVKEEFTQHAWDLFPATLRAAALHGAIRPPGLESDADWTCGIGVAPGLPSHAGTSTLYLPAPITGGLSSVSRLTDTPLAQPASAVAAAAGLPATLLSRPDDQWTWLPPTSPPESATGEGDARVPLGVETIAQHRSAARHLFTWHQPTTLSRDSPRWMTHPTSAILTGTRDAQLLARGGKSAVQAHKSIFARLTGMAIAAAVGVGAGFYLGKRRAEAYE